MKEETLAKLERVERVLWPAVFLLGLFVLIYFVYTMKGPNEKLLIAAKNGDITAVIKQVDDKGADVNAKGADDGLTPLMLAAQNGHAEVVKALLARDADVSAKSNDNGTALSRAEQGSHAEVVKLLKAAGARE